MDNKIRDKTIQELLLLFQDKINECIDTIESQNTKIDLLIKEGLNETIKNKINEVVNSNDFITDGGRF